MGEEGGVCALRPPQEKKRTACLMGQSFVKGAYRVRMLGDLSLEEATGLV